MILIKRYSNRKLYDTVARQYVTLEELGEMIRNGNDIQVLDHASGVDMTTLVLAQIIFEQERKIGGMLPQKILARLIRAGSSTLEDLRHTLRSVLEPDDQVDDEIARRLQALVDNGKMDAAEGERLGKLLLENKAQEMKKDSDASEVPLDSASKEDLESLIKQVEQLEKQLENLQAKKP
jgi:polyhydroxyalkanoate synthesis repressor PhaR